MPATDTFRLFLETQARGDEELRRVEASINRLADSIDKAQRRSALSYEDAQRRSSTALVRTAQDTETFGQRVIRASERTSKAMAEMAATVVGVKMAFDGAAASVLAMAANTTAAEKLVNTYRALRIAMAAPGGAAALGFAAGSVGAGIAIQKTIEVTNERARQVQAASMSAAMSGSSFQTAYTLQRAGEVTGRDLGFLKGYSAEDISAITLKLRGISDPVLRAQEAVRTFGKDGETALKTLDGRLAAAAARAADLAEELDGPTRAALNDFKSFWDNLHPFQQLGDEFANFAERMKIGLAKLAVDGVKAFKEMAAAAPQNFMVGAEGNAETAGYTPSEAVPSEAALIRGYRKDFSDALDRLAPKFDRSTGMAQTFRAGDAGTEASVRFRLEAISQERGKILKLLSGTGLADSTFKDLSARLNRVDGEQKQLERWLKLNKPELVVDPSTFVTPINTRVPSLRGRNSSLPNMPEFVSTQADRNSFDSTDPVAEQAARRAELQRQKDMRERDASVSFARQFVSLEERKIELLAGPGGELAAINKIYELKKAGLEEELSLGAEIFNLRERQLQIEEERTLRLIELGRRRRDETRYFTSDFVGSLQAGRPGDFFRQQGGRLVNQIGTNLLEGPVSKVLGTFGQFGAASGLGGLLKGTLFDPQNATPVDRNTLATEKNTAALERATAGAQLGRGVSIPGAGVPVPGFPGIFASDITGITGRGPLVDAAPKPAGLVANFTAGLGSVATAGLFSGLRSQDRSIQVAPGVATTPAGLGIDSTAARTANTVGSIAALGISAKLAVDGFKRGGLSGNMQGISAALGGAALIPGPQQPFIAAAAATSALIGMLLPDPKKARDRQIDSELNAAFFSETAPMSYSLDRFGRGTDTNRRGDTRAMGTIVVNISTLDSKSFNDNREMFADALRNAIYDGHGINRAMQEAVLAA